MEGSSLNCEIHPNMRALYFCQSKCKKLICEDCLLSHSKHNYVHLLELASEMKVLQQNFEDLGNEYEPPSLNIFQSTITKMDNLFAKFLSKINDFKGNLKVKLEPFLENNIITEINIQEAMEREDVDKMQNILKEQQKLHKMLINTKNEARSSLKGMENLEDFYSDIKEKRNEIVTGISHEFPFRELRAIILGLDASGKTTFLYKMKIGEVITTIPTIGIYIYIYI